MNSFASRILRQEARGLNVRLGRVKSFTLHIPTVAAAAVSREALTAIESYLDRRRCELRSKVHEYLTWLRGPKGRGASVATAQRRLTLIRLRFNSVLAQFDIFSDALTQRSEHEHGVWLAGLDALADDALRLPVPYREFPPIICYLERGLGAAIRRVRTRLTGGGENPVSIIRVPRERMIGSGIASSLVHEVGHQGAALLDLVNSLKREIRGLRRSGGLDDVAWAYWEHTISENIADFWAIAKVGVTSTLGLMGVVSLPRPFVFRINLGDPHPCPWIRVKLSCAVGDTLFPDPQWERLTRLWESYYPMSGTNAKTRRLLERLDKTTSALARVLINHRPAALRGLSLKQVMPVTELQPARLREQYRQWKTLSADTRAVAPTRVFAVIGQARADGLMSAEDEGERIDDVLRHWARKRSLEQVPTGDGPVQHIRTKKKILMAFT